MTVQDLITPGTVLGRYTVERVEALPSIQATAYLLRHELGARHLHIERDDDNQTFAVFFPTVPSDSTGVAHILEHTALMGSRNFPVADPFFSMIPRSLNTFMNAMTASDWTTYLYSTRNEKDFFNLLNIYLDAAFFPLLRYESFRRDGHRFENADPADKTSELKMQGVVYNEMKGAMATPSSVLWKALQKALYPDLTYANNSGGEPSEIPNLTYQGLKDFHAAHYHPSNAYFYTYGNLPLERYLDAIEAGVMQDFTPNVLDVSIPDQTPFTEPQNVQASYPSTDTERGAQALVAWKLGHSFDPDENLRWKVLSEVLLGNAAAPLTRPLIESGLGSALSDGSGYQDEFREAAFAVGLKGLSAASAPAVQTLVLDTLARIASEGLPAELIDSALHQFEIAQKEVSNSGWPYSLKVAFRAVGPWLYGGDPLDGLNLDAALARLQEARNNGPIFEDMIREGLLNNTHRVTLTLVPDPELASAQEQAEREMVARLSADFTEEDRVRVVQEAVSLLESQDTDDDVSILPTLTLSDVTRKVARPAYTVEQTGGAVVGRVEQPTSGLVYLDVQVRLPELSSEELELLPLYAFTVTRSGAAGQDYAALARRIEAVTGGISASVGSSTGPDSLDDLRLSMSFGGKALSRNAGELVSVLRDVIAQPEFEATRLEQLLKQRVAGQKAGIVSSGNAYAGRLAAAQLSPEAALDEQLIGLAGLKRLEALVESGDWASTIERLKALHARVLEGQGRLCVTASSGDLALDVSSITGLFGGRQAAHVSSPLAPRVPVARTTDTPVAYNAVAFQTVPFTHPDSPALLALGNLLTSEYLLRELREKGGAYGGGAGFNSHSGVFRMTSYRDPNIGRTFEVFRQARDFLNGPAFQGEGAGLRELNEAILSASKGLDPLTSPDTVGRMRFYGDLGGYTADVQEAYVERLLNVQISDLIRVMDSYLTPDHAAYALLAGKDPNADTAAQGLTFKVESI
ncbi:insulinase family protein [Deinococcus ruber]|uniref:Metalloprotease n=1 Tax=Deinococcus ruber TaxID=1848197 RepID=A0A918EZD5_9DEIO|nr:insulinase family protein [Deinococcus ruber]GGQ93550.1 metalloprotease [Deinococcus ruber]